jgi:hypothetical protein
MGDSRRVYFLANGRFYEPTPAFLTSFQQYDPTTPVCFIPYDRVRKCRAIHLIAALGGCNSSTLHTAAILSAHRREISGKN